LQGERFFFASDETLLERFAAGEQAAFEHLFNA
jgi:hypothetical protein